MSDTPELKVSLFANNVEVASTTDGQIWLTTMAAITGVRQPETPSANRMGSAGALGRVSPVPGNSGAEAFAAELEVSIDELIGACNPSESAPYIELDHRNWEALKANSAPRGPGSVPGVVLAATLLVLWSRHYNLGKITVSTCIAVLKTIGHTEKNHARSLRNCEWIQNKDDGLKLNPARKGSAVKLARAYILRNPVE